MPNIVENTPSGPLGKSLRLLDGIIATREETARAATPLPDGLIYLPAFLSASEKAAIETAIAAGPVDGARLSKNRPPASVAGVHWHGFSCGRGGSAQAPATPHSGPSVLDACGAVIDRLRAMGLMPPSYRFDQCIVNDYADEDAEITPHVDRACFDDVIVGISFGAPCVMTWDKMDRSRAHFELILEEGSVLLFAGEARWRWRHGIGPRPHVFGGKLLKGGRRTSVALRRICTDSRLAEAWGMNGLRFCNMPPLEKNRV